MMKPRSKQPRRTGVKVWITAVAIVAALFVVGDSSPQLRRTLERMLQEVVKGEPAREQHASAAHVIDGDTLHLAGTRIRLFGIDAPEGRQTCRIGRRDWACGEDATAALRQRIGQQAVSCERTDTDRYGRGVAKCFARGENLNAWMVREGWAVAYRRYGGSAYDLEETLAQAGRRGIWASEFEMPWDWRQGAR